MKPLGNAGRTSILRKERPENKIDGAVALIMALGRFDVPLVFAGLVVVAAMGIVMYEIFAMLERRVTFWATRAEEVVG